MADNPKAATVDLEVDDELAAKLRPFGVVQLVDVPTFAGLYLIDSVTIPLDDTANVSVSTSTPDNPEKQDRVTHTSTVAAPTVAGGAVSADGRSAGGPTASRFVEYALAQAGDRYVFGAEARASDPDPDAFDCSELVEWAAARAGVTFVDGAANQLARCKAKGTVITVDQAIRTRGALLFGSSYGGYVTHVAISLGTGRTIEAVNRSYGVRSMSATGRVSVEWIAAGKVPGLEYAGTISGPLS